MCMKALKIGIRLNLVKTIDVDTNGWIPICKTYIPDKNSGGGKTTLNSGYLIDFFGITSIHQHKYFYIHI